MIPVPATPADAEALGAMHVQAWRETYAGLVPPTVLDRLDPAARTRQWRSAIGGETSVFLVRDSDGIAGFGACGPPRESSELCYDGEIGALYVLRRAQRRGLGRALMAVMARALTGAGRHNAALWVLHGNLPAQRFYAALGGRMVADRTRTRDDWSLRELAYAWDDVSALFQHP